MILKLSRCQSTHNIRIKRIISTTWGRGSFPKNGRLRGRAELGLISCSVDGSVIIQGFVSTVSVSCSNNWDFTTDSTDKFELCHNSYSVIAITRHFYLMLILMMVIDRFGCWLYEIIRCMQIRMTVSTSK